MASVPEEAFFVLTYVTKSIVKVHVVWYNWSICSHDLEESATSITWEMQFNAVARRHSRMKPCHQTKLFWVYTVNIIHGTFCVCVCLCMGYTHSTSSAKRTVHRWFLLLQWYTVTDTHTYWILTSLRWLKTVCVLQVAHSLTVLWQPFASHQFDCVSCCLTGNRQCQIT